MIEGPRPETRTASSSTWRRNKAAWSRLITATAVIAVSAVALRCSDSAGPAGELVGRFSVLPRFEGSLAGIVPLARVRIALRRAGEDTPFVDTTFSIAAGDTAVDLSLSVTLRSADETFTLNAQLITPAGDTAYRAGPVSVAPGTSEGGLVVELPFTYDGKGKQAQAVLVMPADTSALVGDPLLFQAVALDGQEQAIDSTPIAWRSLDSVVATATALGPPLYRAQVVGAKRGVARIVATLLTGQADTSTVAIQPQPNGIVVVSGDKQVAPPGAALPQSVVVQVLGSDGFGVAGIPVRFSASSGGTLTPDSTDTDAQGQAAFNWTLARTVGPQVVAVEAVGFTDVVATVSATALPTATGAIWSTAGDGTLIARIDPATGAGTVLGATGFYDDWAGAFDTDGTLYTLVYGFSGNAVLATVDTTTGVATLIGQGTGTSMISLEFDVEGTLYGIGYNDQILYRIDKTTGAATPIGDTGILSNMDLAFNSAGTLYATVNDVLYTVDPATGAQTSANAVSGVCPGGTIMGIMFDANDVLYATSYADSTQSCLMTIDLSTLTATTIGLTGLYFPHGGDINLANPPAPAALKAGGAVRRLPGAAAPRPAAPPGGSSSPARADEEMRRRAVKPSVVRTPRTRR